ncbi:MAG TPA: hypothetical protein VGZ71_14105 [Puia sp.]|nr:hypothetical protein [Puia sp.]
MKPLTKSVKIPFFTGYLDKENTFVAVEEFVKSANIMLIEWARWAEALKGMRKTKWADKTITSNQRNSAYLTSN